MLNRGSAWLLLISFVLSTLWLMQSLDDVLFKVPEINTIKPDYTMTAFTSSQMDENGILETQLTAATMVHYPTSNSKLIAPNLRFYKEQQLTWTVEAEHGEISLDGKQVWLLGKTILLRHTKEYPMKIISRDVTVLIDTEYAETSAPTTVITHRDKNYSVGVQVNMPTGQVDLLSQVRGHYVLPK